MTTQTNTINVIDQRFAPVADLLGSFAAADPGYSAQLAIYQAGNLVLDASVGQDCTRETMTGVFSCSKGAGALVISLLVQQGLLDLEAPVAVYWPEFAAAGKAGITVAQLLSHQAGLPGVEGGFTQEELVDSRLAAGIMAAAAPLWNAPGIHSYHALTMGVFMEELARRCAQESLQDIFERRIRAPHDIDFYLGLPEDLEPRFRPVLKDSAYEPLPFIDPYSPFGLAVNSTGGFDGPKGPSFDIIDVPNERTIREAGLAALGGVGNARGLARLYAAATTGFVDESGDEHAPFLTAETIAAVSQDRVYGLSRANGMPGAFAIGFMKAHPNNDFGSARAFGHDGANASLGYADPAYGLALGYVPARAEANGTGSRGGQLSVLARQVLLAS
ncbi:serine hydrolase domain-containing protein [Paeniglutamicibacter sp. ORCA_105]|uniref:serine hydrolase domain-containing protein n=1 Tax=Paeniglutamicibacter sp. ORCA_105 TaxID=3377336 RepID=UPI0038944C03